mmetsp:Transcript_2271/g.5189  ORF Transcript_2271/g.5189 Transcript_2271/m.5189 type:complete len:93 (+) Transcript_2271:169-447(+)
MFNALILLGIILRLIQTNWNQSSHVVNNLYIETKQVKTRLLLHLIITLASVDLTSVTSVLMMIGSSRFYSITSTGEVCCFSTKTNSKKGYHN